MSDIIEELSNSFEKVSILPKKEKKTKTRQSTSKYLILFEKLAQPDEKGFSRWVYIEEFIGEYTFLITKNGGAWSRRTSPLNKKYNIDKKTLGNRTNAYKLNGFNEEKSLPRTISKKIRDQLSKKCAITTTSSCVEIDHKNGRYNNPRVLDVKTQTLDDFQPLHHSINKIKREKCKKCKESGKRFNAKELHFSISYTEGTEDFGDPTNVDGCVGCYWYDIEDFHKKLIKK